MKSYFLQPITSPSAAISLLNSMLPRESASGTWLIKDLSGDSVAYLSLVPDEETSETVLQVDVSGRHYNKDLEVLAILETLKKEPGGAINISI